MRYDLQDVTSPALRARLNGGHPTAPPRAPTRPEPAQAEPTASLSPDVIRVAVNEYRKSFGIKLPALLSGRLLIQGNSGAGKSWLLRKILEESAGRIQQIIVDPDSEFRSLAELLDYPIAEAHRLDLAGAAQLAARVRHERLSLVLDLGQVDRAQQMIILTHFVTSLIACSSEHWHPALIAIDEAQLFAPLGGQGFEGSHVRKASVAAIVDLMSRGRKRGLAAIVATQRLARLSKSVVAEAANFMIGVNTLDLDIRRAAETIGWDARRAFDRLPMLSPGNFVAVGSAFTESPQIVTIGAVRSRHLGSAPALSAPTGLDAEASAERLGLQDLARQAEEAARLDEKQLPLGARAVRDFVREPAFPLAGQVFMELSKVFPRGTTADGLATHLEVPFKKVTAAVALLESFGIVEIRDDLAIRIRKDFQRGTGELK